jgi:transposase
MLSRGWLSPAERLTPDLLAVWRECEDNQREEYRLKRVEKRLNRGRRRRYRRENQRLRCKNQRLNRSATTRNLRVPGVGGRVKA